MSRIGLFSKEGYSFLGWTRLQAKFLADSSISPLGREALHPIPFKFLNEVK